MKFRQALLLALFSASLLLAGFGQSGADLVSPQQGTTGSNGDSSNESRDGTDAAQSGAEGRDGRGSRGNSGAIVTPTPPPPAPSGPKKSSTASQSKPTGSTTPEPSPEPSLIILMPLAATPTPEVLETGLTPDEEIVSENEGQSSAKTANSPRNMPQRIAIVAGVIALGSALILLTQDRTTKAPPRRRA